MYKKKTRAGYFARDKSGLWHYTHDRDRAGEDVWSAAEDALQGRPKEASWFWFNGTPAPMFKGDGKDNLYSRWNEWRNAYQSGDPSNLLGVLGTLNPNA
jgi:hypothetical protein